MPPAKLAAKVMPVIFAGFAVLPAVPATLCVKVILPLATLRVLIDILSVPAVIAADKAL